MDFVLQDTSTKIVKLNPYQMTQYGTSCSTTYPFSYTLTGCDGLCMLQGTETEPEVAVTITSDISAGTYTIFFKAFSNDDEWN